MNVQIPWITAIIPTYGEIGVELTAECLRSMDATHPGLTLQKIVVDDGSGDAVVDKLVEVCTSFGAELVSAHQNGGFAKTVNLGLRRSNGIANILVNNDIVFSGNPVLQIMSDIMRVTNAGVVGTRLLYPDGTIQHAGVLFSPVENQVIPGYFDHFLRGQDGNNYAAVTMRPSLVTGALFAINRGAINCLGLLDERFGMAAEDIDYCVECVMCGFTSFYCGYGWAYHAEGKTRGRTIEEKMALAPDKWETEQRGLLAFFKKWQAVDFRDFSIY